MSKIVFSKDFSRHPLHYFTLLCAQLVGLWGIFWFDNRPAVQMVVVISMAVSYVVWGIAHHSEHRDLHIKIVIEYILVALLAVLLFGSLLLRA
ncbi:hypothetical protein A3H89_01030 [Candidatus Amesbacteria bacterium RIFCSPLOWO2_02_FULL_48_11]|uniref:Uncharacterized protein n=5 Tax=Candidatus Amesiibacteriota TaxID=1752730 RepID=A0A1F4Z6G4_9BACT|nr:MAG: hypothetical protein UX78_C0020G0006 [Candidatus Amesbacteria bacterium GW2011_GWA2_47_11]KKU94810.1 MAG: hypothetical protein UY22_C0006G0008 [Candidatus Amesbacteria bacterium GW2011_GWC1_48_10]KKW00777.1 MAG: hypothetical protein UY33_C0005G0006 [Candidatus Amesbacteria bacterium GW2011_GWA1_48_9]OGC89297.1 MAG: hypothetical protein A2V48_03760 [Candidatus Amesbacteria bacterium RBG_19FT_COMBO_48_16]OGC95596.1 MAG: hypothetical protein A3C34_00010 [Candidatus Amesbacteria bacterium R